MSTRIEDKNIINMSEDVSYEEVNMENNQIRKVSSKVTHKKSTKTRMSQPPPSMQESQPLSFAQNPIDNGEQQAKG